MKDQPQQQASTSLRKDPVPSSEMLPNWLSYQMQFLQWLCPDDPASIHLFAFVRHSLRQFHLDRRYCEAAILHQVFWRAYDAICQKGKRIESPLAWTKATVYNLVREYQREQARFAAFDVEILTEECYCEVARDPRLIRAFFTAFQQLSAADRQLLMLKVVEGLSWKEIRSTLSTEGANPPTEAALRKRKQRLLTRLNETICRLLAQSRLNHSSAG